MTPISPAYEPGQYPVTDTELVMWTVVRSDEGEILRIKGPCPSCGHDTAQQVEGRALDRLAVAAGGSAPPPPPAARMTRICECACSEPHPDGSTPPQNMRTCGRWWLVSIMLDRSVPGQQEVVAALDDSLLTAARAAKEMAATEEKRLRTSAEKWIAGITALIGLFSLSGVVVGKDSFTGLPDEPRALAGFAAAAAIGCAVVAVMKSYRAAYGWPIDVDISNDELLKKWFDNRRDYISTAVNDLKTGVRLSLISLGSLALAAGFIWFWPRDSPTGPLVQVVRTDDARICGTLLNTTVDGELRIRRASGAVETAHATGVRSIKVVPACA
ncbi:hypothetical protein [Kitasatospora sp. NPDC001547]|uniref:hypothetical protein n=1 Tax=Kitasatospora sp. NPDC001547 TaxID=3364015 RepID=UPI0036C4BDA4|nr:hypothetical protein KitaXyl93_68030 [Kitasatospora sp. Xyl93]